MRRALVLVLAVPAMVAPDPAAGQLRGATDCTYGAADCTRPVPAVEAQFRSLRRHGDLLGFRMGVAPDISTLHHWQGVQRLSAADGRFLAVSRAGGPMVEIVHLRSRPAGGGRLRANRFGAPFSADAAPPQGDAVVENVEADPGYDHAGGMQAVGHVLAVPLEAGGKWRVKFLDVSDPRDPQSITTLKRGAGSAGTASLAKLADGRHLLIVGRAKANRLSFYRSRTPGPITAATTWIGTKDWREDQLIGNDSEFGDYQNLNLVADPRGRLFLIGTHTNVAGPVGRDFADLFALTGDAFAPVITKLARRHFTCGAPGRRPDGSRARIQQCDFDAASGAYVDPEGRLLLYATEYDNDGPGRSVKAAEFRTVPHRPACADPATAWVELYDDTDFGDRSVMVDYLDRGRRSYGNYDRVEAFEDKASAARWCLPPGWRFRMFEDKRPCGGRTIDLVGSGEPAADHRFKGTGGVVAGFNDDLSCSRWIAPPAPAPTPVPTPAPTPTATQQPSPSPSPSPTPGPLPDLVVSDLQPGSVTVRNQGAGPAGSFAVTVQNRGDFTIPGLAPGASATRTFPTLGCGVLRATADSYAQVTETDEGNNALEVTYVCR